MQKFSNLVAYFLLLLTVYPLALFAEPPAGLLGGKLELQEEVKKENPYQSVQSRASEIFTKLSNSTSALASGEKVDVPTFKPDDPIFNYLAAVYLYCISRSGSCPFVLDAVLETDVIQAAHGDSATCPNMQNFWKIWLQNDFEKRSEFLVRTGDIREFTRFNQKERPSYVQCASTIKTILKSKDSRAALYRERYAPDSELSKNLSRAAKLLQLLKEQKINVFKATGAK